MKQKTQRKVCMPISEYKSLKKKNVQLLKVKTLVAGALDFIKKEELVKSRALLADAMRVLRPLKQFSTGTQLTKGLEFASIKTQEERSK